MTISTRNRHVAVIATAALALGLGGFTVAAPAHADTSALTASVSYDNPSGIFVGDPFWIDTAPGVEAWAMPATGCKPGCLWVTNTPSASSLYVRWIDANGNTKQYDRLVMQNDGNFVFYNLTKGKTWGARTRAVDNPKGPGVEVTFQNDANLVVRNAAGTALWASNTHTYPDAFLAVQSDGNLVIYESKSDLKALWATGTE